MEDFDLVTSGTHKDFNTVIESKGGISESEKLQLKKGDLIVWDMEISKSPVYHVGTYCGRSHWFCRQEWHLYFLICTYIF